MNYELAKELKDAGFPQLLGGKWIHETGRVSDEMRAAGGYAYLPTLSELIEACGDQFKMLVADPHIKGRWIAFSFLSTNSGSCPSPDEAVARLWLALNAVE